ncbi:MAG: hypothetical protein V4592_15405 [Bacteroidota bacterium]
MMLRLLVPALLISACLQAQTLKIRDRKPDALNGSQFARSISDTAISLKQREQIIYKAIKKGNIPQFYRKLVKVTDSMRINYKLMQISYYVLPDYIAIGTDSNYFYCPMTPGLAQRVANKLKCSLPTRQMADQIYRRAAIKVSPLPIPPTPAMSTVPVFIEHNQMLKQQRDSLGNKFVPGSLMGGDKKDVIISNRIYNDTSNYHVVIYGWHKILSGKAIQPLYARHLSTWADYSHGIRLIQNKVWVNGKETTVKKVLQSSNQNPLLSDEGPIKKPWYPTKFLNLF